MPLSYAPSQLVGTLGDDVILNASGNTTSNWTIATGRYLDVQGYWATIYSTSTSGTINGALRGSGGVEANPARALYVGAGADLSAFSGNLRARATSTNRGTLLFYGSSYAFPGALGWTQGSGTPYLRFDSATVAMQGTWYGWSSSVELVSALAKTSVTFSNVALYTYYSAGYKYLTLTHGAHDVTFLNAVQHGTLGSNGPSAAALTAKTGTGTMTFGGNNGNYIGTFTSNSGTIRITGTDSMGPSCMLNITGALEIAHNASHKFSWINVNNTLAGVGTSAVGASSSVTATAATTVTARPDTATNTAGDFSLGRSDALGAFGGAYTLAPDGGIVGGSRNIIRVKAAMRASSLTIDSGLRTGATPAAGQEGVVIVYGRANAGTTANGTTTVTSGSVLRVNSPDGSDRLCTGMVTVQAGGVFEVENVASAAASVKGRHVYPGGLTLAAGSRLNIGVTPL